MIDGPGELDTVLRHPPTGIHGAGVVDQDVDALVPREQFIGEVPHRALRGEVGKQDVDRAANCLRSAFGTLLRTTDDCQVRAQLGELAGRGQADAAGRASDDDAFARDAHVFCDLPSRR